MNYGAEKGDATIWYRNRNLEWRLSCNRETSRNPPLYRAAFFFLEGGLLNLSRICARRDGLNLSAARIAFSCVFEVITPVHPLFLSLALAGTDFHLIKSIWTETTCADNSPFRRDYHRPCHFVGIQRQFSFFFSFSIQDRSWSGHLVDAVITKWRRPSTMERSGEKALPNAAKWTILVRRAHATGKCERKMCCCVA